ncbi:MAG: flagellar type III secretion system pore protein FliP [Fimbriimonadaceae bacterium]|nr:flagellar type III secretion system pore protein FliP [Fimbriimonadaceae bacterium]QOJ12316.1 MAG: flagellar type III secretion system pore protein FliP [Chthonomonadaceae bacterium]
MLCVHHRRALTRLSLAILLGLLGALCVAQQVPIPKVSMEFGTGNNPEEVSTTLKILAMLTVLSLAPAILMLTTAFTRIVIVLSFLRQAIGTPSIPPNQVLIGLSLFLTFFVMGPTYQKINEDAIQPYLSSSEEQKISFDEAVERAQKPLREFMLKNTYESDLRLFLDMREERPDRESVSLLALIPAFILSELKTAFIIGFYLFIPFLIVDLIVASGLMSMGMMMLPPTVVSLPAKLLVFVLADGWGALVSAILQGYR